MIVATLCLPVDFADGKILLGMKKRGFGKGKWNGFGGKVAPNEGIEQATTREIFEEAGITPQALEKVALLHFEFEDKPEWEMQVHAYITRKWKGQPSESEEMKPKWFSLDEIPLEQMWDDDTYWLTRALAGEKLEGWFLFGKDEKVKEHQITPAAL